MTDISQSVMAEAERLLPCSERYIECRWDAHMDHREHSRQCPAFYTPAVARVLQSQDDKLAKLVEFFTWAMREGPWSGSSLDGDEMQEKAAELGLITETTYDPKVHGPNDCDAVAGDTWFEFARAISGLITKEPQS